MKQRKARSQSKESRHCDFKLPANEAEEGLQRVAEAIRQIVKISKTELEEREAKYKAAHRKRPNPTRRSA